MRIFKTLILLIMLLFVTTSSYGAYFYSGVKFQNTPQEGSVASWTETGKQFKWIVPTGYSAEASAVFNVNPTLVGATIYNSTGQNAILNFIADAAEDNDDNIRLYMADSGALILQSYASAAWLNYIEFSPEYGLFVYGKDDTDSAIITFYADQGTDNNDQWRMLIYDGGPFSVGAYTDAEWEDRFLIYDTGEVRFLANDNVAAIVNIWADDGADDNDRFRLSVADGGNFSIDSYATGGWTSPLILTNGGNLTITGSLTFVTSLNIVGVSLSEAELSILDGLLPSQADLNIIDGISDSGSLTAAEILIACDGATGDPFQTQINTKTTGPGASTDTAIALWDGVTGYLLKNSVVTIDVSGNMSGIASMTLNASSTPSVKGYDSDVANDQVFEIVGNGDATDSDVTFKAQVADAMVEFLRLDGQGENIVASKPLDMGSNNITTTGQTTTAILAETPQSKDYSDQDDLDQTVGTDITSSVVLVTGDNDTNNDGIDMQAGTVAGQMITFIAVAGVDADDIFKIDLTDGGHLALPTLNASSDADELWLNAVGESVTIYWNGSAWSCIAYVTF